MNIYDVHVYKISVDAIIINLSWNIISYIRDCGFKYIFCFVLQFSHSWYMKNLEQGMHSSEHYFAKFMM